MKDSRQSPERCLKPKSWNLIKKILRNGKPAQNHSFFCERNLLNDFLRAITCQIAPNTVISEKMHPTAKLVLAKPQKSAFSQNLWPNLKNQPFRALPAGLIKVLRVPGQISCLPVISSRSRRPSAFCKVCPFKNTKSLMHTEMQNRLRLKLQASKNVIFVKVSH